MERESLEDYGFDDRGKIPVPKCFMCEKAEHPTLKWMPESVWWMKWSCDECTKEFFGKPLSSESKNDAKTNP